LSAMLHEVIVFAAFNAFSFHKKTERID